MPRHVSPNDRRYPDRPMVGVGVVVWRNDKVLLVKRKNPPRQGEWGLPGGAQNLGETLMETAVREVREETGLDIRPMGVITALDGITRDKDAAVEYHFTIIEILADALDGDAIAQDDALDVIWVLPQDVVQYCAWLEVARVVHLSSLQRVL